jgi:hypothetical protein
MKIKNKDLDQAIADTMGVISNINFMQEALENLEKRMSYMQYQLIEFKRKQREKDER